MNKPIFESEIIIEAPFYDVDSMEVVWHGNYVKYLEDARCAMLDKIGYNYLDIKKDGYAWPIVQLKIKYIKPFIFKQKILIKTFLVEYENCLKIDYLFFDLKSGNKITKAQTMQVAVNIETGELCYNSPQIFLEKIEKIKNNEIKN